MKTVVGHARCMICGCKADHHKGGNDDNGPEGLCPQAMGFGKARPMNTGKVSEEKLDNWLTSYWSKSPGSVFI